MLPAFANSTMLGMSAHTSRNIRGLYSTSNIKSFGSTMKRRLNKVYFEDLSSYLNYYALLQYSRIHKIDLHKYSNDLNQTLNY